MNDFLFSEAFSSFGFSGGKLCLFLLCQILCQLVDFFGGNSFIGMLCYPCSDFLFNSLKHASSFFLIFSRSLRNLQRSQVLVSFYLSFYTESVIFDHYSLFITADIGFLFFHCLIRMFSATELKFANLESVVSTSRIKSHTNLPPSAAWNVSATTGIL